MKWPNLILALLIVNPSTAAIDSLVYDLMDPLVFHDGNRMWKEMVPTCDQTKFDPRIEKSVLFKYNNLFSERFDLTYEGQVYQGDYNECGDLSSPQSHVAEDFLDQVINQKFSDNFILIEGQNFAVLKNPCIQQANWTLILPRNRQLRFKDAHSGNLVKWGVEITNVEINQICREAWILDRGNKLLCSRYPIFPPDAHRQFDDPSFSQGGFILYDLTWNFGEILWEGHSIKELMQLTPNENIRVLMQAFLLPEITFETHKRVASRYNYCRSPK